MMNRWLWLLLIVLCWAGAGVAIFGTPPKSRPPAQPVPNQVNRIIAMSPNITEILFALGLEEKIVGVTLRSDYPPAAAEKPKVGTFWQPNIEAIIAARPDLVITLNFPQQKNLTQRLNRMGCRTLTVNREKVGDLFQAIKKIGRATGQHTQAEQLVRDIKSRLNKLSQMIGSKEKLKVLWVVQRQPLRVAGTDTFVNEMIALAGGENAIGPTIHEYPPIGGEQVIACSPDIIIEPTMGLDDPVQQREIAIKYWSRFSNVPAVMNGRIYVICGDAVSRPGPRLYEGTETIARCLWPKLFEN